MNKNIIICLIVIVGLIVTFLIRTAVSNDNLQVLGETKTLQNQILKASYSWGEGLQPTQFIVKKGIPVRLEVFAEIDGFGCMGSIMIPAFSPLVQTFVKGQTHIFEFTPEKQGEYEITCAMGIPHGSIIVE